MRLQNLITDISIESVLNKLNAHFDNARSTSQNQILRVFTPNPEMVMEAKSNKPFFAALKAAEVRVPDGIGLVIADWIQSKFLKQSKWKIKQRIAGVDLAEAIINWAADKKISVVCIGGITRMEKVIDYKNFKRPINYLLGPKEALTETEAEWLRIKTELKVYEPKILLVGFGAPKQELWIDGHVAELKQLGIEVVMTVGGAVDVWFDKVSRAPAEWRNWGLEWLWRLIHQPWRIGRQLRLIEFGWLAFWIPLAKAGEWFDEPQGNGS